MMVSKSALACSDVNMAAIVRSLVVTCVIFSVCSCSPTTELLETVSRPLIDFSRFYPHADLNMAENSIVRLQVAVDSVQAVLDTTRKACWKKFSIALILV